MKKIILSVCLLISFVACPVCSHADYIIHLKHGGQFITPKYWAEGGQIHFFVRGGSMGIEKDTIKAIEKSKFDDESGMTASDRAIPMVTQTQGETITSKASPDANVKTIPDVNAAKEKVDVSAYQNKMNEIKAEANEARRRLREAIRNKDAIAEARAAEDRQKIAIKKRELTNELKEKNNGKLPADWDD